MGVIKISLEETGVGNYAYTIWSAAVIKKLLMDAPHNRRFDAEANGMTRVMDWSEAYIKICELAQK